jgi:ATP-dependent protease HslVU (ClpYQ) peptidase subunit
MTSICFKLLTGFEQGHGAKPTLHDLGESLMSMKAQLVEYELCKKNLNRAVTELAKEKRDGVIELEKLRAKLAVRDGDVKVAMEAKDKAVAKLQHLAG